LFYYLCITLTSLTGGLFIYVAAPYASYIFFNDLAFWKYLKYYPRITIQLYHIIFLWITDAEYRGMYAQPLSAPPSSGPDRTIIKLSPEWKNDAYDCARCINCCTKIKCPLLDHAGQKCLVYNSVYWRYFSCGRFPVSQKQIDYYQCPKWEIRDNEPGKSPVNKKSYLYN